MLKDVSSVQTEVVFTTSTGVTVKIRPVSRFLISQAQNNIRDPKPPIIMMEDKGRSEPNPNDPDYIAALIAAQLKRAEVVVDIILALGVEVVSIGDTTIPLESDIWEQAIEVAGLKVPTGEKQRLAAWLKYIAVPVEEDLAHIITTAQRRVFTMEADVNDAAETFRSDEARTPNNGVSVSSTG